MPLSEQERQLIEILREWTVGDEFRLEVERINGAWEITLTMPAKQKAARGVGRTFAEAWDNVAPTWA